MGTYAIGDLQGCYDELIGLLERIEFDDRRDTLWFVGDLVNRGPKSLDALRFVKGLGELAVVTLGNHDLHLLACALVPGAEPRGKDTLDEILAAPDRDELLGWLRRRRLAYADLELGYTMVHAGVAPQWSHGQLMDCAAELETVLAGDTHIDFLRNIYGDSPDKWDQRLSGFERLRFITNCLTRMRFCSSAGRIDHLYKGPPSSQPGHLLPWYAAAGRKTAGCRLLFGHWSALSLSASEMQRYNVYPLDTGAVWGGELTAMRLQDGAFFSVPSAVRLPFGLPRSRTTKL
jgi:bis(5'-nucleosyl)-tetraphosphatase (symmetrical)